MLSAQIGAVHFLRGYSFTLYNHRDNCIPAVIGPLLEHRRNHYCYDFSKEFSSALAYAMITQTLKHHSMRSSIQPLSLNKLGFPITTFFPR